MVRPKKSVECASCKWFHKGVKVNHNHCDFQGRYDHYWDRREERANGRKVGKCHDFKLMEE